MGLSGRLYVRMAAAVGVALGLTLLLLAAFYNFTPFLMRDIGALLTLRQSGEDLLQLERGLLLLGCGIFTLAFLGTSLTLGRWLEQGVIQPLTHLRQAAQEITTGEQLPEIPREGEGEVADLAVAFDLMRLRLKESMRLQAKADEERLFLFSSITHDLQTPLTALLGSLEMLQLPQLSQEKREYYTTSAQLKARQIQQLISDLLLFSKLEAGQDAVMLQETELLPYLAAIIAEHSLLFTAQGGTLLLNYQLEAPLYLELDRERFPRVLQNVLDNARRYLPPQQGKVVLTVRSNGSDCLIEVKDNGSGLAPGVEELIFQRFYRGESSRMGSGSGLGLAIARQIVTNHRGAIWAKEPEGEEPGCTIVIALPIKGR